MYLSYFGLDEPPFSIAPNPKYLYFSDRHKEALMHLSFGLGDNGGFVQLTGEVGTGKTTITKAMLKDLPESTQVAFILNPALSELDLLASICDELGVHYDAGNSSLKSLTDAITSKLIKNYQEGGHTVVIIDEAQHLAPSVLEQLRLLTNLETDDKKLLQIVLIGQPELGMLMQRTELRQLAQRITTRYHLIPLSESQVFAYIQHRLQVAGCQNTLFSHDAVTRINQLTNGVPRLINLLADRCLLGAFSEQKSIVDEKIVSQAAKEALPVTHVTSSTERSSNKQWRLVGVVCLASYVAGFALSYII